MASSFFLVFLPVNWAAIWGTVQWPVLVRSRSRMAASWALGGPGLLLDGGDDGGFGGENAVEGGLLGRTAVHPLVGGLIFGAQPANVAVAFFFGALGVEGNEVFEDFLVVDVVGPAVGVEHGDV